MNDTAIIIKRRWSTKADGSRTCVVTYQRPNGTRFTEQTISKFGL
jgi:hypothetical protein